LGYLGVVNGRPWGLAVPSRLFDGWILVHHCRHRWRMCAVSGCVSNGDVTTSLTVSCGRAYHVGPLFLVLWRKSTRWLALIPENWCNYPESRLRDFPHSLPTNGRMTYQSRAGQFQRKGGPHNLLRTRQRAALEYIRVYIEKWKLNQLKRRYL
jgi:hypothetical protein